MCLHSTAGLLFYLTGIHSVNRKYTPNGYLRHHIRPCIFAGRHHCQTKKMNSMRTLTTHRLLDCFREAVQKRNTVSENILSSAYDEFLDYLLRLAKGEMPLLERLRHLYYLELELDTCLNMAKEIPGKYLHICLTKAAALVKTEIGLLHFSIEHPEYHTVPSLTKGKGPDLPPLYWKGSLANLMELIASLDYSGLVTDGTGNRQSFASLVAAFESFFHVSLPKPYDLRADLARRKKSLSVLLPKLREAYEKNIVNCGIGK